MHRGCTVACEGTVQWHARARYRMGAYRGFENGFLGLCTPTHTFLIPKDLENIFSRHKFPTQREQTTLSEHSLVFHYIVRHDGMRLWPSSDCQTYQIDLPGH